MSFFDDKVQCCRHYRFWFVCLNQWRVTRGLLHLQQFGIELCQCRQKSDLSHLISQMGNEIRTVRFPHKMHRRRVSFCNQCDIPRSRQVLHCRLTDWVFGDLGMRFLHLRLSKCLCYSWFLEDLHRNEFFFEFCFYLINQLFYKSVLSWFDEKFSP